MSFGLPHLATSPGMGRWAESGKESSSEGPRAEWICLLAPSARGPRLLLVASDCRSFFLIAFDSF